VTAGRPRQREQESVCLAVDFWAILPAKLIDYFRVPQVSHYIIVELSRKAVIHHCRAGIDRIDTALLRQGPLVLDPPGLNVQAEDLLA
jgi:phosphoglycerate dehydrogenase-like enzyme